MPDVTLQHVHCPKVILVWEHTSPKITQEKWKKKNQMLYNAAYLRHKPSNFIQRYKVHYNSKSKQVNNASNRNSQLPQNKLSHRVLNHYTISKTSSLFPILQNNSHLTFIFYIQSLQKHTVLLLLMTNRHHRWFCFGFASRSAGY